MTRAKPRAPFAALPALLLALAFGACSNQTGSVGEGLLGGISGQSTRRDTLQLALSDTATLSWATFPMHVSAGGSASLLVGQANGLEATTVLRFGRVQSWRETRYVNDEDGEAVLDTITYTPLSVRTDTSAFLRVAFASYLADSGYSRLQGWVADNDWDNADSVQTPAPSPLFGQPLFESDTLNTDPDTNYPLNTMRFDEVSIPQISGIVDDSLTIVIKGLPGTNMLELPSINQSTNYGPQLVFWIDTKVESAREPEKYADSDPDSLIGISLRPIQDTYRMERIGAAPSPEPVGILVAGGSPWRGWFRIDRFELPGLSVDGQIPAESRASANSAILELDVVQGSNWFQGDELTLQVLSLVEDFEMDSANANALSVTGSRLTYYGFNEQEGSGSEDLLRRFQIADMVNSWWQYPDENNGFLIKNSTETDNVNALEITGARLILVTSTPPVLQKPTADTSGTVAPGGARSVAPGGARSVAPGGAR